MEDVYKRQLPWCMVPEKKITVEDVKYVLSSHFQGTPYDPYAAYGEKGMKGAYRSIGINRNDFLSVIQMRPEQKKDHSTIEWVAFASNAFNVLAPFYADVEAVSYTHLDVYKRQLIMMGASMIRFRFFMAKAR